MLNYYQILGVSPTATSAEIKSAFRKKVKALHPDLQPSTDRMAFQQVVEAYRVLSEPGSRQQYDLYWTLFAGFSGAPAFDLHSPLDWIVDLFRDYSPARFYQNLRVKILQRITGTLRIDIGSLLSLKVPLFVPLPLPSHDPAVSVPLSEIFSLRGMGFSLSLVHRTLELYNRANEAVNRDAYETAERLLHRSIELYPGFLLSHFALGNVYRVQGKTEQARRSYQTVCERDGRGVIGRLATRYLLAL